VVKLGRLGSASYFLCRTEDARPTSVQLKIEPLRAHGLEGHRKRAGPVGGGWMDGEGGEE
jgi:hypothetical protein